MSKSKLMHVPNGSLIIAKVSKWRLVRLLSGTIYWATTPWATCYDQKSYFMSYVTMYPLIQIICYIHHNIPSPKSQAANSQPLGHGTKSIGSDCCGSCWAMSLAGCTSLLSWTVVRQSLQCQSQSDCQFGNVELGNQNHGQKLELWLTWPNIGST